MCDSQLPCRGSEAGAAQGKLVAVLRFPPEKMALGLREALLSRSTDQSLIAFMIRTLQLRRLEDRRNPKAGQRPLRAQGAGFCGRAHSAARDPVLRAREPAPVGLGH